MKTILAFIILTASFLTACKDRAPLKDEHAINNKNEAAAPHEDHSGKAVSVALNNGEKWPANAETSQGINNMVRIIHSIPQAPNVEDYHATKIALDQEFNTILKKCTMTGEAHDQLHNYLLPLKEIIDQLGSESIDENKKVVARLDQYLNEYSNYFQ